MEGANQLATAVAATAQTHALAMLAPRRLGDPLGIRAARPPPPPDPDEYSLEKERTQHARSLLTDEELKAVEEDVEKRGYLTIENVRDIVAQNITGNEVESIDADLICLIDARTRFKIFIVGDNVYTREEMFEHFAFQELNTQPEDVLAQQEIGVFPPSATALNGELEYMARDVGDETIEFMLLEDQIRRETRKDQTPARPPLKVAKTKVYIAKEAWKDFMALESLARGAARIAASQAARGKQPTPLFAALTGAVARPALTDQATLDAEAARREEALRAREEALEREARRQQEIQKKIQEDLDRIEKMCNILGATKI